MNRIEKFISDAKKIKKRYRAENPHYDGEEASRKLASFFCEQNRNLASLASSFADYWLSSHIITSSEIENEPTDSNIDILSAMQALIDNEISLTDALSADDLKELCKLTSFEAESIPLEILDGMMGFFVEKQAM